MPLGMQIGSLCVLAAGLVGLAVWVALRKTSTPEKRERRRRLEVHATGRLGDAMITEATEDALFYTYSVRGVQYAASQDIGNLRARLPAVPDRLIGSLAGIKYSTRNPANSILICEEWSGLRTVSPPLADSTRVVSMNDDAVGHQPQNSALAEGAER